MTTDGSSYPLSHCNTALSFIVSRSIILLAVLCVWKAVEQQWIASQEFRICYWEYESSTDHPECSRTGVE
uniref:Uncharacterized protein n=1 Tax=Leersia perrieri TaxID=77586 RepID=A0A0D9UWA0_9ORYZ